MTSEAVGLSRSPADTPSRLATAGGGEQSLAGLDEVPVQVEVRLGQAQLSLGDLLRLSPGAVLGLDRGPAEPAELMAGGKVIARGEIVVAGGRLGLRLTEVDGSR